MLEVIQWILVNEVLLIQIISDQFVWEAITLLEWEFVVSHLIASSMFGTVIAKAGDHCQKYNKQEWSELSKQYV